MSRCHVCRNCAISIIYSGRSVVTKCTLVPVTALVILFNRHYKLPYTITTNILFVILFCSQGECSWDEKSTFAIFLHSIAWLSRFPTSKHNVHLVTNDANSQDCVLDCSFHATSIWTCLMYTAKYKGSTRCLSRCLLTPESHPGTSRGAGAPFRRRPTAKRQIFRHRRADGKPGHSTHISLSLSLLSIQLVLRSSWRRHPRSWAMLSLSGRFSLAQTREEAAIRLWCCIRVTIDGGCCVTTLSLSPHAI